MTTAKQIATEWVSKNFEVLAKANNFKGVTNEASKSTFETLERLAKQSVIIGIDCFILGLKEEAVGENNVSRILNRYLKVKEEVEKL